MSPPGRGRSLAASLTSNAGLNPPNLARSSSGAVNIRWRNCTIVRIRVDRADRFATSNARNASA